MIETILIVGFSLTLFAYWFRYTVLLLLREEHTPQHTNVIGQLHIIETSETLRAAESGLPLDSLERSLQQDYKMLRYLLDHAAGMGLGLLEQQALVLDFRLMDCWYRLTHKKSALVEMAGILRHIAYKMGERSAALSHA